MLNLWLLFFMRVFKSLHFADCFWWYSVERCVVLRLCCWCWCWWCRWWWWWWWWWWLMSVVEWKTFAGMCDESKALSCVTMTMMVVDDKRGNWINTWFICLQLFFYFIAILSKKMFFWCKHIKKWCKFLNYFYCCAYWIKLFTIKLSLSQHSFI